MSTETKLADSTTPRAPTRQRRAFFSGRAARLGYWGLVAGLLALNGWLAWEARPLADLKTITEWMSQERYPAAEKELRAHLRRSPHNGEARLMLARVLAARNDLLGCALELHQVPDWWPKKHEALLREGQSAMLVGRAKQAEAAWRACIAHDSLHPTGPKEFTDSVKELITLYNVEQRKDEVRDLLWAAYQEAAPTEHATILIMRVWVELLKNDPTESSQKLRRFINAMPDDWEARRALARNEMALGNEAEATRQIKVCLQALPGDVRIWRDWLAILAEQGDQAGLSAAIAKLPPAADSDATIWRYRGMLREQTGDWQGAAQAYLRAIRLQPSEEEAYYKLSIVAERLGAGRTLLGLLGQRTQDGFVQRGGKARPHFARPPGRHHRVPHHQAQRRRRVEGRPARQKLVCETAE